MDDQTARFHIRKLWPLDTAAFRRHLLRLDPDTRHERFGTMVSDHFLETYANTARRIGTVIFGAFIGPDMHASAELRALHVMGDATAEAAFAVEKNHQHHGLGSILMDRIVAAARNRGIGQVHMICARDNSRMQHLAEKFGARINNDHGEMLGKIAPEAMTPLSLLDEAMHDTTDFVTAVFDWRPGHAA
jgi:GNAT superfamily N-acetyltransferase